MTGTRILRWATLSAAMLLVLALTVGCTPIGSPAPPPTQGVTKFGSSVWANPGETYNQAVIREGANFGPLRVIRQFSPGMPSGWSYSTVTGADLVASFKAKPLDVLSGMYDNTLRNWFATAPAGRNVYWTYYHEPEDNIRNGEFTASDYRAAWVHLTSLARATNSRLHSTLILMNWSLEPASGRNWRDYYPGDATIDVLGWDAYSFMADKGRYDTPEHVFGPAVWTSRSVGKPFAFGEFGATLANNDPSGTARAAWITASASYIRNSGALWAAYFDAPVGGEFRLMDAPSAAAWRAVMAG